MIRHPLASTLLSFLLVIGSTGCASIAAAGRAAHRTTGEETSCPDPGVLAGSHPTQVGLLQKEIADALPCAFTSTAWEPPGSTNLVVYLTPLNDHTRSVAQAIVDKTRLDGIAGVTLKQGAQSFSRAEEQSGAIERSIPRKVEAQVSVDRYGVVTVEMHGHPVSDASIAAASHVPGYQAEPVIVDENKPTASTTLPTPSTPSDCLARIRMADYERKPSPMDPPVPGYRIFVRLLPQVIRALPCNFSGSVNAYRTSQYVIFLAPLDRHARAVVSAIIANDPEARSSPAFTLTLLPGKQSLVRAEAQVQQQPMTTQGTGPNQKCAARRIRADGSVYVVHWDCPDDSGSIQ